MTPAMSIVECPSQGWTRPESSAVSVHQCCGCLWGDAFLNSPIVSWVEIRPVQRRWIQRIFVVTKLQQCDQKNPFARTLHGYAATQLRWSGRFYSRNMKIAMIAMVKKF